MPTNLERRRIALIGGAAVLAVFALALFGLSAGSGIPAADAQTCSGSFTIDFAGLPAGTVLGEQYASSGVHISGEGHHDGPDALIVFDSNSTNTDLDADLRVGIGNIAIFAKNLNDANGDGLIDRPDENDFGGRAVFAFDQDVSIGSFKFVDKDHEPDDFAFAYDASGNVIKQAAISPAGNGSVQTIAVNADGVRRFEVVYGDSGGFTGIEVDCGQPSPAPTAPAVTEAPTAPTDTPTAAEETPTPTTAPTAAPSESATATPTVAAAAVTPSAGQSAQGVAVAGESAAPRQGTAVLGADALPAGGGSPGGERSFEWALLIPLVLVLGGSAVSVYRARR